MDEIEITNAKDEERIIRACEALRCTPDYLRKLARHRSEGDDAEPIIEALRARSR